MLRWAVHLGGDDRIDTNPVPSELGEFCLRRWITAMHLRAGLAPDLTIIDQRNA